MICPKCAFDNPAGMAFCGKCGGNLARQCPDCEFVNPPEFQFCGKCGARLAEEAAELHRIEDMQGQLSIPEPLRQRMESAEGEMAGENRPVTALFADISGFTSLSESLATEAVVEKVNQSFRAVTDAVYRYEGSVDRFIGGDLLLMGGQSEAVVEACFDMAIDVARRQSAKTLELRAEMSLARLRQRQGKRAEARNMLAEVYNWFTEGFDTADLKDAKSLLEALG